MQIKKLKVEEGFFDGLELDFSSDLNVLVGGRGVGKTSVIELLRFGLGVDSLSSNSRSESESHAISILQSTGRVTVELEEQGRNVSITRSALDDEPSASSQYSRPIIFSQKEVETISMNAAGRLALVDSFNNNIAQKLESVEHVSYQLKASASKLAQLKRETSELVENSSKLPQLLSREQQLVAQQNNIEKQNSTIEKSQGALNTVQADLATLSVNLQNLIPIKDIFQKRVGILNSLKEPIFYQKLSGDLFKELNYKVERSLESDSSKLNELINVNLSIINDIKDAENSLTASKIALEEKARINRSTVESFNQGFGAISAELGRLRQQIAQLQNTKNIAQIKQQEVDKCYADCQSFLEQINLLRGEISSLREEVLQILNTNLHPDISTSLKTQSNLQFYTEAIESSLRGSGLKYKELVPLIAQKISPAWLLYYATTLKYQDFAEVLTLPIDRATRLLGYFSEIDLGSVLTAKVEDVIDFSLLDHGSYKQVDALSIGQRCTVALSIILENSGKVLIVDQPEDHLDNEFIAKTLIKSISQRAQTAQTILSSHNANIPVLGNANNVINLDSNGRKGFIKCSGSIDAPDVKRTIESIMEGGKDAFQRRSAFYSS